MVILSFSFTCTPLGGNTQEVRHVMAIASFILGPLWCLQRVKWEQKGIKQW